MWRSQFVTSRDGCRLFSVSTDPREGIPLLLIPGIGVSHSWWERQLRPGMLPVQCASFDLRGHGASAKPEAPEAYQESERWAEDVEAVITAAV